jgi:hypothetical protein
METLYILPLILDKMQVNTCIGDGLGILAAHNILAILPILAMSIFWMRVTCLPDNSVKEGVSIAEFRGPW